MSKIDSPQHTVQNKEQIEKNPNNLVLPENSETKKTLKEFYKKLYRKFAEIFLWDKTIAMSQKEWNDQARKSLQEYRHMLPENNPSNARFSQSEIWFENDLAQMAAKNKNIQNPEKDQK